MNFYRHHLGDYAKDTPHLSLLEHGVYGQLMRRYYSTEQPLPANEAEVCRVIGARAGPERAAVKNVLRDFFELREDGYHQKRIDSEIEEYRERSKSATESVRRRWGKDTKRIPNVSESNEVRNANEQETNQLGNAKPVASSHKPVTSNQNLSVASATVFDKALAASASAAALPLSEARINPDTPAGILASVCVANGIRATGFHPLVVEWARNGVTVEGLKSAIATARIRKPSPQKMPVAYLDTILADVGSPKPDARWRTDDGECERVARELGLWPARAKESWQDLRNRIAEALHSEARKAVQ